MYENNKEHWEEYLIEKRVDRKLYMIKDLRWVHKLYLNQLKKSYSDSKKCKIGRTNADIIRCIRFNSTVFTKGNRRKRSPTEIMYMVPKIKRYDLKQM